jgi:pimeloyl-ACP methyl ester carboxylesterase
MQKTCVFLLLFSQLTIFSLKADVVVGIHGLLNCNRSMRHVERALCGSGFDVFLWQYRSREKFIEQHGCDLVRVIRQIAYQYPGKPIHFVTHSIGGLVLRAALNNPLCPREAKIGSAVLLAPPNQGSSLGRRFRQVPPLPFILGNRSGWEILNYTPYDMSFIGNFPPTMRVLVIAGTKGSKLLFDKPNDGYVLVTETALNTPYQFLCFPVSHGDLLKTPAVLYATRNFLCRNSSSQ